MPTSATATSAAAADARATFLRVHFGDGAHADFWLRHHCDCCRHPQTGERTLCASQVPLTLRPMAVHLEPGGAALTITWDEPHGHRSTYKLDWLRTHAYALQREELPAPPGDVAAVEVAARRLPNGAPLREVPQLEGARSPT